LVLLCTAVRASPTPAAAALFATLAALLCCAPHEGLPVGPAECPWVVRKNGMRHDFGYMTPLRLPQPLLPTGGAAFFRS
jgi:hypothetical protein